MGMPELPALGSVSIPSNVRVLKGCKAILECSAQLEELAARCGQPGAMNWLGYFLEAPEARHKTPYLVLTLRQEGAGPDTLESAALLFEYTIGGVRTGAFTTDDMAGFRTIIAPQSERAHMAALAAKALLHCGAHHLLLSYVNDSTGSGMAGLEVNQVVDWALRQRTSDHTLVLESSFDATLAKLGKNTRRNMRYYRKKLLEKTPCEFVADARGLISERKMAELNERSLNPVPEAKLLLRHATACDLGGSFLMGIRSVAGEWLSLAGGWRQDGLTVLNWQMNTGGYEKDSLCTVMRSMLIEHEIEQGTRRLVFYGGTTHSIHHAFEQETVCDLLVRRRSLQGALLRLAAHVFAKRTGPNGQANFFARTLRGDGLAWRRKIPVRRGNDRRDIRSLGIGERRKQAFPRQD